ncbi:MAG: aldo/keto reductase [Gammaproteobacteria bacterium]|nr:aldo/keto reductase [Gammaproteobacteria bacterium]
MIDRRSLLRLGTAIGAGLLLPPGIGRSQDAAIIAKKIPGTGEALPAIGMGTWKTFQVMFDKDALAVRTQILREFFARGGAIIDSSPMYGRAEAVVGTGLKVLGYPRSLFKATKVWIIGRQFGINQMKHSESLWGRGGFDLMQIHNMLDWDTHLETLREWKAAGRIRYIGITTSEGRRHDEMLEVLGEEPFDFAQFTYNIADREPEKRLLPLAADRGIAVIANRPFEGGNLFDAVRGKPLPEWAGEFDCVNWAQFFLKFAISHPAVTCAIPATRQPVHMIENMGAGLGKIPDPVMRRRMVDYFNSVT